MGFEALRISRASPPRNETSRHTRNQMTITAARVASPMMPLGMFLIVLHAAHWHFEMCCTPDLGKS
jgi:hypothetical protein